jgi:endo-1,4-beta-xylanase
MLLAKKFHFYGSLLTLITALLLSAGCPNPAGDPEEPAFVPVTDIAGVPSTGTAGSAVDLSAATALPAEADNKAIVWTVKDAGTTGLSSAGIVNGVFTPAAPGTLTLTAAIANGSAQGVDYSKDFTIAISAAGGFVPVTDIAGVPSTGTAGAPVDLSAAAALPAEADNKAIVWTVKDAGTTGLSSAGIVNGVFTPAAPGTLTLSATIANGSAQGVDYSKDFTIAISATGGFVPVTNIAKVPTGGTAGTPVDLSAATVVPAEADNKAIVWTVKEAGTTGLSSAGIVNGIFTPAAPGTLTLTATIANGSAQGAPFIADFVIIISAAGEFVPVMDIVKVPDGGTAGIPVDLSAATVAPDNAANKSIAWTVKDAGTTGLSSAGIVNGVFTPAAPGTLTLTATIANGSSPSRDYTKEFEIIISPPDAFVPVSNIAGVPSTGTAGTPASLSGATVVPGTATYKSISWVVKDDGGTGVSNAMVAAGSSFIPGAAGTLILTARILSGKEEGTPYTQDFAIEIEPAFVPVSDIEGMPETRSAIVGAQIDLNPGLSVVPPDATNSDIEWIVKSAGATGLTNADVASGVFTPRSSGTATLTAVIMNGRAQGINFAKDIGVAIITPVTGMSGVPTRGTRDQELSLAGVAVLPADATNRDIVWSIKSSGTTGVTAITDSSFTPPGTGVLVLTATIADGSAIGTEFAHDYTIRINGRERFLPISAWGTILPLS